MSSSQRQLHLGFTVWPVGFHPAGWRLPEARTNGNDNHAFFRRTARLAEAGLFDFFFIGDRFSARPELQLTSPNQVLRPEALSLAGFVAGVTEKIGIVTTINVTYADPYSAARSLATLDHLSGGRMGWNIVTGEDEVAAANFSRSEHWNNARRYEWATEFAQVVKKLWDSWEDDALIADKETGQFIDENRVHRIEHRGAFFSIDGPLNSQRPPQGQLPIVNAGHSQESVLLGAQYADIKFTDSSTLPFEQARAYYARLKQATADLGRDPDQQFVIPGVCVYTAHTSAEAHALYKRVQRAWRIPVDLSALGQAVGADLSGYAPDEPIDAVPPLRQVDERGAALLGLARELHGDGAITLEDLFKTWKRQPVFREVVGSPAQVADLFAHWFEARLADGFMIFPPYMDGGLDDFVKLVIPELQRRGLFRTGYEGSTLREHFGLPRPKNAYAR